VLSRVERWLRLPPPPTAPPGDEGTVRIFQPSPRYLRLRIARWVLVQAGSLVGLVLAFGWYRVDGLELVLENVHFGPLDLGEVLTLPVLRAFEVWGALFFLVQLPVTLAMVRLDCTRRWYLVTDRSLRVREGLRTVRERTMSFANIQNLAVRQGPVQRLFAIADLRIRTAGGGGSGEDQGSDSETKKTNLHLAVFHAVDNPEEIRDLIFERMRRLRDHATDATPSPTAHLPGESETAGPLDDLRKATDRVRDAVARLRRGPGNSPGKSFGPDFNQ